MWKFALVLLLCLCKPFKDLYLFAYTTHIQLTLNIVVVRRLKRLQRYNYFRNRQNFLSFFISKSILFNFRKQAKQRTHYYIYTYTYIILIFKETYKKTSSILPF